MESSDHDLLIRIDERVLAIQGHLEQQDHKQVQIEAKVDKLNHVKKRSAAIAVAVAAAVTAIAEAVRRSFP